MPNVLDGERSGGFVNEHIAEQLFMSIHETLTKRLMHVDLLRLTN